MLLTAITSASSAQSEPVKRKSVFFEIAGSGGIASINLETHFLKRERSELTWRAGLSLAPIDRNNGTGIVFPVMISALIGHTSHKLELGMGQGVTITTKGRFFTLATGLIGYRYQQE